MKELGENNNNNKKKNLQLDAERREVPILLDDLDEHDCPNVFIVVFIFIYFFFLTHFFSHKNSERKRGERWAAGGAFEFDTMTY